jgi:hypothetical protein
MAYASMEGLKPEDINDDVMAQFAAALEACGEVDNPREKVRIAIHAWNRSVASVPERALATLHIARQEPKRWTLKPEEFPETFRQDVECWLERVSNVEPEAEEGPIRPLRPATLKLHKHQIFAAASALAFAGKPVGSTPIKRAGSSSPAELILASHRWWPLDQEPRHLLNRKASPTPCADACRRA